jgi:hypothetical protein
MKTCYKCLDPDCGKLVSFSLTFKNVEGRIVRKCAYCRGKVEEVEVEDNDPKIVC